VLIATKGGWPGDLVKMAADGTNQQTLTSFAVWSPSWTSSGYPGGQKILFTSDVQGPGVYSTDANGGSLTKIVPLSTSSWRKPVASPALTPTGSYEIIIQEIAPGENYPSLYSVKPDGTGWSRLTAGVAYLAQVSWLPSANGLIAIRNSEVVQLDLGVGSNSELVVTSEHVFTFSGSLASADKGPHTDVSPDGQYVVIAPLLSGWRNVWVFPRSNPASAWPVTANGNNNRMCAFDQTGSFVYFVATLNTKHNVHVMRADGTGAPAAVTNAKSGGFFAPALVR